MHSPRRRAHARSVSSENPALLGYLAGRPSGNRRALQLPSSRWTDLYNITIPPPPNRRLMIDPNRISRWLFAAIAALAAIVAAPAGEIDPRAKTHWAFQPIANAPIPKAASSNPIDAFIAAILQANGLSFSPPADKRTLLRRAYFDLIGLPPTFAEVQAFERDTS